MVEGEEVSVDIGENERVNFWKNRRVFVTGATGVGSWLVEALVQRQAHVTCLIRDWVPGSRLIDAGFMAHVNLVHGELEDYAVLVRPSMSTRSTQCFTSKPKPLWAPQHDRASPRSRPYQGHMEYPGSLQSVRKVGQARRRCLQ